MAKSIQISILTSADLKGIEAVTRALEGLSKAGGKANGLDAAAVKGAQGMAKLATASAQAAVAQDKVAISSQRVAQSQAQAATASQNFATAQAKTATALAQAEAAQTKAAAAALRLQQAQERAAQGANASAGYFRNFGAAVKDSLTGAIAPAAAAAAALGAVVAVGQSFADAFKFKAQIDETRAAITAQVGTVRDMSTVYSQAAAFGTQYKFTQSEINAALQASIPLLKSSKASTEQILSTLARLGQTNPEEGIKGAAFALAELNSGDVMSLVERFRVGKTEAYAMRDAIASGGDAVTILDAYLNKSGATVETLATRTQGAAGKLKDLAAAQEEMKLAQADFAAGPGLAILEAQINVTRDATKAFGGDLQALNSIVADSGISAVNPLIGALQQYNDTVLGAAAAVLQWAGVLGPAQGAQQGSTAATQSGSSANQAFAVTAEMKASATAEDAQMLNLATSNAYAHAAAVQASDAGMQAAAATSLIDAANKQTQASQTELLTLQTNAAVDAFLALNPNMTATQAAGVAAANGINPLIGRLAAARLAAIDAANALASFNAQAGIKAAGGVASAGHTAGSDVKNETLATRNQQNQAKALARVNTEQQKGLILARARGDEEAQIKILKDQQNYVAKDSIEYAQLEGQIITANASLEREAAKGAKGGKARVDKAAAAGEKIAAVEQKTGNKLEDIDRATQNKLIEIDRKAAEERAKIAQQVNETIARDQASMRVNMETNDFDALTATDDKQKEKIADRERAEMASMDRLKQAQQEAQNLIAEGRADEAKATYEARKDQVSQLQDLDIKYAEVQRELADDPEKQQIAAQQYEEAKRAIEEQANTEIQIAAAAAETKAGVIQDEKDQVIAAASEQAGVVISRAQESAAAVKNASADAKNVAVANLKAIGDAVNAIPASKDIKVNVIGGSVAGVPATAGNRAAGGGSFVTSGPTTLTVGDNPGGIEHVSVTPISGKGTSRASGNLIALAGGGDVVVVGTGDGYTTPLPSAPAKGKKGKGGKGKPAEASAKDLKAQLDEQKNMVQLLKDMIELRGMLEAAVGQQPFDVKLVAGLVKRAREFTEMVRAQLVPLTKDQGEGFKRYTEAARAAISVLSDVANLRKDLQDASKDQPFDMGLIKGLALRASQFVGIVRAQLVPMTEFEVEQLSRYQDAVSASVDILGGVAELRKDLADQKSVSPFDMNVIKRLATDAKAVTTLMRGQVLPTTEEQAKAISQYADAVGSSLDVLSGVSDLRKSIAEGIGVPITPAQINELVVQANDVVRAVDKAARVYDTKGLDAAKAFNEAFGSFADAGLSGLKLFDAINTGDFRINPRALAGFERDMGLGLQVADRLGVQAAKIDGNNLAALGNVSSILGGLAETAIKLAAVPFGDIGGGLSNLSGQISAGVGAALGGGVGGVVNNYNTFNMTNANITQLAEAVVKILNQKSQWRRT